MIGIIIKPSVRSSHNFSHHWQCWDLAFSNIKFEAVDPTVNAAPGAFLKSSKATTV